MNHLLAGALLLSLVVGPAIGAKIPREAPDLTISMPGADSLDLADYEGKVVALEFLKTTCPTCRHTAGILQKLQTEYGPKGFQVLGAAVDDDASKKVAAYVTSLNLSFPVGYVPLENAYGFLQHSVMKLMQLPQLVFIDKKGNIRAQYGGTDDFLRDDEEANIRGMIDKLMAE